MRYSTTILYFVLVVGWCCIGYGYCDRLLSQSIPVDYCGSIVKEDFAKKAQSYQPDAKIQKSIEYMFPADTYYFTNLRYKFGQGLITTNISKLQQSIKSYTIKYGINFGVLLFLAFLHIIIIPLVLLILCCCKSKKKQQNDSRTSCTNYLPYLCIGMLLIGLIIMCSVVVKINVEFVGRYQEFKCSLGIITNDLLEGGKYNNGSIQFKGLKYYLVIFQSFIQNITNANRTIQQNLVSKSKPMINATQQINIIADLNSKIPNDSTTELHLQYANPLLQSIPLEYQNSTFPSLLGTTTQKNTLIFNFSSKLSETNQTLLLLSTFSNNFNKTATFINISEGYQQVTSVVKNLQNTQYNIDATINILDQGVLKVYTIGSYVVLGFTFFIGILTCIGMTCFSCWSQQKCRNTVCGCCVFLWIVGILYFLLASVLTLLNPVLYHGCQYVRQGFGSVAGYNKNFGDGNGSAFISKCLTNSPNSSYFYQSMLNDDIKGNITQLRQSFPSFINCTQELQQITNNYSYLLLTIENYRTSKILDIGNKTMISQIQSMSTPQDCFPDSWIPSLQQIPQFVHCMLDNDVPNSDNSTCYDIGGFENRGIGCVGCMDTFLVLQMYDNYNDVLNSMMKRYQSCIALGKSDLLTKLTNLWYNYDYPKKTVIGYIKQKADKMANSIGELNRQINNSIQPNYASVRNWMVNDPLLDQSPNSTLAKEMNCKIVGLGIDNSIRVLCNHGLVYVYYLRFLYSAIAVTIYLICLCLICLTRRKNQSQQVLRQNDPYDGNYGVTDKNIELRPLPESERKYTQEELKINSRPSLPL